MAPTPARARKIGARLASAAASCQSSERSTARRASRGASQDGSDVPHSAMAGKPQAATRAGYRAFAQRHTIRAKGARHGLEDAAGLAAGAVRLRHVAGRRHEAALGGHELAVLVLHRKDDGGPQERALAAPAARVAHARRLGHVCRYATAPQVGAPAHGHGFGDRQSLGPQPA